MKRTIRTTFALIFCLSLFTNNSKAQESTKKDTMISVKRFKELVYNVGASRVITTNTSFETSKGKYEFAKNKYLPIAEANCYYGWLINRKDDPDKESLIIKTGCGLFSRTADLKDSIGNDLRLSSLYLQIPFQYGIRYPLRYNTIKNNLTRAVEWNTGFYAAIPITQRLDHPDNVDSKYSSAFANYLRFGVILEVAYSALDNNGHGHRFGLKYSVDFTNVIKLKETKSELYPSYYTVGIFYNIANNWH